MTTFDGRATNGDNNDPGQTFDLIELPQVELEAAWQEFVKDHILPARLLRLAAGLETATDNDRRHLEWCHACCKAYQRYLAPTPHATPTDYHASGGDHLILRQQDLWPTDHPSHFVLPERDSPLPAETDRAVPSLLRKHLHVEGPIVFIGNEVAFESWQFGRLSSMEEADAALVERLISFIAEEATSYLESRVDYNHLMLVCFGRAMHRCGTRIAADAVTSGRGYPHVVLAHDFYSPTVVCDPKEFSNADVIVLVDVVHSGATLNRLMSLCLDRGARGVRGLAFVDQSDMTPLCSEWFALWREPREQRVSLEAFLQAASSDQVARLHRFEPNGQVALHLKCAPPISPVVPACSLRPSAELMKHIHDTGAFKRDHMIGKKRYPYAVNVLDLVKKSTASRAFILARAAQVLEDLRGQNVALAFHAGRRSRAGVLATTFSAEFGWPAIPVGRRGDTFVLTDAQLKQLARHDVVVIVDAAIRTGDTLAAMVRAVDDKWLLKHSRFVALCILNALSHRSRTELAAELGIEIRTLFELPLAPPTEEVRHWMNMQKARICQEMASSALFSRLQDVLSEYCAPSKARYARAHERNISETRDLVERAVNDAQRITHGALTVEAACAEGKAGLIRHLPISAVVHDPNLQEMLIGVMFNSMKPSLKESAVFALASARNYEWMTLDWLKLNRPFITSARSWKSVVMVECEMNLAGRHKELHRFRDAAVELRDQVIAQTHTESPNQLQLAFRNTVDEPDNASQHEPLQVGRGRGRLVERLDAFIAAAE